MPTFGVTSIPAGFETPEGCVVKQVADRESIDAIKFRDEIGKTIRNIPGKMLSREVTIELEGAAPLALVTAGEFVEGTLKATRVRKRENNEGVPESTVTLMAFSTYPPEA